MTLQLCNVGLQRPHPGHDLWPERTVACAVSDV